MDDIIVTCKNKKIVRDLNENLKEKYKDTTYHDDKVLSYLGMLLDNSNDEYLEISMPSFIKALIEESGIDINSKSDTPASTNLFEINEDAVKLDKNEREDFHTLVAKLLYLSKRGRPDVLLPVTFLCTRVQSPDVEDKKKLIKVLKYLNTTVELGLRIHRCEEGKYDICVYCDASFATHKDYKSHTGAVITVGKSPVFYKSCKQKLNSKSSMESEMIALSDVLPQAMFVSYFLEDQMSQQCIPTFMEDNMSAITMLKNGRALAESTRHINIRYFLLSDYLLQGKADIKYINTSDQVGDFYTKPLVGDLFLKHRDTIMGHVTAGTRKVEST